MLWYEHLMGILAIFACINCLVIIAAIRVGTAADAHSASIIRSLNKATGTKMLQQRTQKMTHPESDMLNQPLEGMSLSYHHLSE